MQEHVELIEEIKLLKQALAVDASARAELIAVARSTRADLDLSEEKRKQLQAAVAEVPALAGRLATAELALLETTEKTTQMVERIRSEAAADLETEREIAEAQRVEIEAMHSDEVPLIARPSLSSSPSSSLYLTRS